MDWIYYLCLIALLITGLFVNLLGLPGLWLMVAAHAAFGLVTEWNVFVGWPSVVAVVVLAGIAEIVEFLAGAAGSKAAGGSKRGMIGAVVGGLAGGMVGTVIIPIPVIGTIVGAVAGAGLGAYGVEVMIGRQHTESFQIGVGAAKGRFLGILAKTGFGVAILLVSVIAAWPTGRPVPAIPSPTTAPTTVPTTTPATTLPATLPATAPAVER